MRSGNKHAYSFLSSLTGLAFTMFRKGEKVTNGCGGSFLSCSFSSPLLCPEPTWCDILEGQTPPQLFVPRSNFLRHFWSFPLKIDCTAVGSFLELGRVSICLILAPSLLQGMDPASNTSHLIPGLVFSP